MIGDLLTYHKQPDKLYEMSQEDLVQLLRSASAVLGQRTERVEALASANKQLKRRNQQLERDLTTIRETTDASTTGQAIKKSKGCHRCNHHLWSCVRGARQTKG